MAMNVAECDRMIRAAARHRVKLQIGFMRRFETHFLEAWKRIRNGEIGDVVMVRSLTYGPSVPKPWMYDIRTSNGPLAEVNSHDIDTLRWFTGSEFEEVYAIAGNYRCPDARAKFPDFYDTVTLSARFRNGMQGLINGAQGVRYGYDARCEVLGTRGVALIGQFGRASLVVCGAGRSAHGPAPGWRERFRQAYLAEDREFVRCIREDRPPAVTGHDGRMAVAVVNAGNRSIVERRPVKLTELGE
jgi:myo-inositol 2-dehydrogenase/D-chiro-inositol 1-dehydrogenase/scyllo-inositol 2-dehydrogenase (NAD+)